MASILDVKGSFVLMLQSYKPGRRKKQLTNSAKYAVER